MAKRMSDIGLFDECFTHEDHDGTQTTYWAKGLSDFCRDNPDKVEKVPVPVDEEHAVFMFTNRGVEEDRLRALVAAGPDAITKPIVFIKLPNDEVLLVDGTHRYVLFFHFGAKVIPAYLVPWDIGKQFIIEDAPKTDHDTLMSHSYIADLRRLGLHND